MDDENSVTVPEDRTHWTNPAFDPHNREKFKPEYCQIVIDHMSQGRSVVSFAAEVGVSKRTVYNWAQRIPEFADAIEHAQTLCERWWENKGQDSLDSGKSFNDRVYQLHMMNRFNWQLKEGKELSGEVSAITRQASEEEQAERSRIAELRAQDEIRQLQQQAVEASGRLPDPTSPKKVKATAPDALSQMTQRTKQVEPDLIDYEPD